MNAKRCAVLVAIAAIFVLTSCSGLKNRTSTTGSGNALLSVSISDTPPANTSILSFTLPIAGIALVPSGGGSQVSVFSSGNFELTRLQSDSGVVVANASVAAGTYTAVNVTVTAPSAVFINSSGSTVGTCLAGRVCSITGSAATITFTFPASAPLVLSANAKQWLALDFNYNNAIVTTGGIGIDVTQTGVLTATSTVPTGVPSGDFANVDDFTGKVTAISSSIITLASTVRGGLTATITSSTQVFDPQTQCGGATATISCIKTGSIVSLQGVLTNAGAINARSLDIIDISTAPADEVEGTIYASNCNGGANYGLILSDSAISTSGSPLASAGFGQGVCLTLSPSVLFAIDDGILTGQPGLPVGGFSSAANIFAGQTVRAKVTGAATGTNGINATATEMMLRPSRLTGTVGTVSGNAFTITGLPSYITAFTAPPQVQTYVNATLFEGVTGGAVSGVTGTVAITALFLDPSSTLQPLQAAKVRQH